MRGHVALDMDTIKWDDGKRIVVDLIPTKLLDNGYTIENIHEGVEWLGLEGEQVEEIIQICLTHKNHMKFLNRFSVPKDLNKKEYEELLKKTQSRIDDLKEMSKIRECDNLKDFFEEEKAKYIDKKENIKKILKFSTKVNGALDINKAKQFPITELIKFDKAGFAKCIVHVEKTGSMKYYPKQNKVHCFSCSGNFDAIDIYQKLNNCDFNTAVRALM